MYAFPGSLPSITFFLDTDTSRQTDDLLEVDVFEDSGSLKDISCVSFSLESLRSVELKDTKSIR